MIPVSKIFEILPGHGLELCNMITSRQGIPFVNRSSKNNGVACRIDAIADLSPLPAHTLDRYNWKQLKNCKLNFLSFQKTTCQ